jgi:hypothetical protein
VHGQRLVLEAVNSAYRIYRPNGTSVRGHFSVNDLFNEVAAEFTTDPRCYFDPGTNTWFTTILFTASACLRYLARAARMISLGRRF